MDDNQAYREWLNEALDPDDEYAGYSDEWEAWLDAGCPSADDDADDDAAE
jgi:hypothetical protein